MLDDGSRETKRTPTQLRSALNPSPKFCSSTPVYEGCRMTPIGEPHGGRTALQTSPPETQPLRHPRARTSQLRGVLAVEVLRKLRRVPFGEKPVAAPRKLN